MTIKLSTRIDTISIHALRGEDDSYSTISTSLLYMISIHALRGEDDNCFQWNYIIDGISIHALRGEDDSKNIQICNIVFVHSAYKIIYFCDSCAFYLT